MMIRVKVERAGRIDRITVTWDKFLFLKRTSTFYVDHMVYGGSDWDAFNSHLPEHIKFGAHTAYRKAQEKFKQEEKRAQWERELDKIIEG